MIWTDTIRNSKLVVAGVTYRAHNNQLVVSTFGTEKRHNVSNRDEAKALAESLILAR